MAIGDVTTDLDSIADNGYLNIQPAAGEEWSVHNIYAPQSAVELYRTDGTNEIMVWATSDGGWFGFIFHVNNDHYLRVKNVSGGPIYIGYDGKVTK